MDTINIGMLTVTFDVRYVTGDKGERIAARQAEAITALARWAARSESTGESSQEEQEEA